MRQHIAFFWHRVWPLIILVVVLAALMASLTACSPRHIARTASVTSTEAFQGGVLATPLRVPAAKTYVPYNMFRGPNTTKRVALTYDDCPRTIAQFKTAITYAVAHDIGLAIFPTGDCVKSYRHRGFDLVTYARQRGVWVGNHSMSHPALTTLSSASVKRQIGGVVKASVGRPPYGAINTRVKKVYASLGMQPWLWNVDTNDWKGKSQSQIVTWVIKHARPSSTVLMHMQWHAFNPSAMRQIKQGLAARHLSLCRVWRGEDHVGALEVTSAVFPKNIC